MHKKVNLASAGILLASVMLGAQPSDSKPLATTECGSPFIETCVNNTVEPPYIAPSTGGTGAGKGGGKTGYTMLSITI